MAIILIVKEGLWQLNSVHNARYLGTECEIRTRYLINHDLYVCAGEHGCFELAGIYTNKI